MKYEIIKRRPKLRLDLKFKEVETLRRVLEELPDDENLTDKYHIDPPFTESQADFIEKLREAVIDVAPYEDE